MSTLEVRVPNIGGFKDVGVVDVLVKPGDAVAADASLVTVESDKATMDVPAPVAGTVREVKVKVGDRVSEGSLVLLLEVTGEAEAAPPRAPAAPASAPAAPPQAAPPAAPVARPSPPAAAPTPPAPEPARVPGPLPAPRAAAGAEPPATGLVHASPSVRKLARELGVDLSRVTGSGPRGRVLQEDVQRFVKQALAGQVASGPGLDLLPWPRVDFSRFGPVETRPLSRIRKIAGANLSRNWVMIPHVTQFDEADVTELEDFRARLNAELGEKGPKVTLLAFLVKACVAALQRFPEFNSSLDGESLVLKRYWHVGFAADTPNGLVVPVVRDADRKGILEIARELAELAAKAREGKLAAQDIQGGTFSISSLGGIGGTAFTPIVNAPEVAILGASRVAVRPVWDGERFAPRKMLPLSLSYDHRVIDGAAGARFTTYLAEVLRDLRRAML
ncbi:MAG TPA: dihydrolipoyllysine-residue acetyltransferase [Anaeromyxobacteraceae bacterium]|nr:dihydrolipoyllysine-residue acetyltransferase [Anaeromyxobacteraceae bacterium]